MNSPYAVKDYRAVNPEFGTLADLRALVDGAHARGMSVMLDWVANHTGWDHAWITEHPDWYQRNAAGTIASPSNNGTTYNDVAQLNFSNVDMRAGNDFGHEVVGVHGQRRRLPLRLRRLPARPTSGSRPPTRCAT